MLTRPSKQWTPLGFAVHFDSPDIVQLLLKYGASLISKFTRYGREYVPLEYAKENGKSKSAHLLIPPPTAAAVSSAGMYMFVL